MVSVILMGAALAAKSPSDTGGAVRAEARATIVHGVTIIANAVRDGAAAASRTASIVPPPRTRACDATLAQPSQPCKLIVYDLP